jgi:predicted XRE-type DNA-binding protein
VTSMSPMVEEQMQSDIRFIDEARVIPGSAANDEDDLSAKSTLAMKINTLIDERGLSQVQAADLLCMSQPKISAIRNHKLKGISLQRLMHALTALGQQVEIVVTPSLRKAQRRISVAA